MIKSNMLTNPFEKFGRKRFLCYSKDLGVTFMNHVLFARREKVDSRRIKEQIEDDLRNYYRVWECESKIIRRGRMVG